MKRIGVAFVTAGLIVATIIGVGSTVASISKPMENLVSEPVVLRKEVQKNAELVETYSILSGSQAKKELYKVRTINPENVVLLNVGISDESVEQTIQSLQEAGDTVYLVIDSPGGSVFAGTKLVNHIRFSGQKIVTVCESICASMGFHIFEAGTRRIMSDKALLMGHPASGGARGNIHEMITMLTAIKDYTERMDRYIADRAKIPYEKFELMNLKNLWIESNDAVKMGLADEVAYVNYPRSKSSGSFISIREELIKKGIEVDKKTGTNKLDFYLE